jgi:hypothetical protein
MRRFLACVALASATVPATLVLGLEPAHAEPSFPSIHQLCAFVGSKMAAAEHYGDWVSYDYWYNLAEGLGCIPDPEVDPILQPPAT